MCYIVPSLGTFLLEWRPLGEMEGKGFNSYNQTVKTQFLSDLSSKNMQICLKLKYKHKEHDT